MTTIKDMLKENRKWEMSELDYQINRAHNEVETQVDILQTWLTMAKENSGAERFPNLMAALDALESSGRRAATIKNAIEISRGKIKTIDAINEQAMLIS